MLEIILMLTVLHILSNITVGYKEVTEAPKQKGKR